MEAVQAVQAIITGLYTTFLLRDVIGKVVPGGLIIISMATLFARPSKIVEFIKELPVVAVVVLVGVSWTLMLGLQEIAYWTGFLHNFTPEEYVTILTNFHRNACPDDKLEYERFEVIKEASANLLIAVCISITPIVYYVVRKYGCDRSVDKSACGTAHVQPVPRWRLCSFVFVWGFCAVVFVSFTAISGIGLFHTARLHERREKAMLVEVPLDVLPCSKASPTEGTKGSLN